MPASIWDHVLAHDLEVPTDRPLDELTTELTIMLGSADAHRRDETALRVLATWIRRGVYDDLLAGLGDGMVAGLAIGLGEVGTDTVFRRSCSALVLAVCLDRNLEVAELSPEKVLEWGDRLTGWFVREQDLRGWVPGKGRAHAIAHGADAVGALGRSPGLGVNELTVLLDVLADRILATTEQRLVHGEPDRLAVATLEILGRDLVPLSVLEPWVARIGASAGGHDETAIGFNAHACLRALHLHLTLGRRHPAVRADLVLALVDVLRDLNAAYFDAH
ncbi:DUF2785 domain-containing protein [Nocardioides sp. JQ2195]|uniref:DUF2785 domain-containing protein n=1 Tax=Nocardioides sp. JQ2195 TaxID=2592334 RepID=UPI00143E6106|nr:DUF2785 domain-containing protein [Nocardioides sp. JQ2195]QIX27479.1 DUF2785 domain-containing protein [Nocardioides sp. JQ2195]